MGPLKYTIGNVSMLELQEYRHNMEGLVDVHVRDLQTLPREAVDEFRLTLMKDRFSLLKDRISVLKKMADVQGVSTITSLDDAAPLLFQHAVYKSYPPSLIERGNFKALTKWLDQLSAHDLGNVDVDGVQGIDDWLLALQQQTPVTAIHTTGTSGRISIIPRTERDTHLLCHSSYAKWEGMPGERDCPLDARAIRESHPIPIVHPTYRYGFYAGNRALDYNAKTIGDPSQVYALYDELLSPDVLALTGRVAAAEARGALDELEIPEHLIKRFTQNRQRAHDKPKDEAALFDRILENLAGKRVLMTAVTPILYPWAQTAVKRGYRNLFSPESWLSSGGGKKGMAIPDDWREVCAEVFGAEITGGYGMSELVAVNGRCSHGHYHAPPYLLTFILDPETGEPLPRRGTQTGRAAFYDLAVESYWAGFVTGDRVTIHWDGDCPCGRKSEYFEDNIQRFSELTGGEDKISCAGAPDAQEKAIAFLNQMADA